MLFKCISCGKKARYRKDLVKRKFGKEGCYTLYRCRDCWIGKRRVTKKDMSQYQKIKKLARMREELRRTVA